MSVATDENERVELVSVLLPVYNCEKYVEACLCSLVNQTYENIEIVIVDDGSTDESLSSVQTFIENYNKNENVNCKNGIRRFEIIKLNENKGIVNALNIGLTKCESNFIFRMDCDDIMFENKIEMQIKVLNECNKLYPNCVQIIGTAIETFTTDESNKEKILKSIMYQCGNESLSIEKKNDISICNPLCLKWNLLFYCSLNHPTVLFDKKQLNKVLKEENKNDSPSLYYDSSEECKHCEDYQLWFKLLYDCNTMNRFNAININQVLLKLRKHDKNISNKNNNKQSGKIQYKNSLKLRAKYICKLLDLNFEKDNENENKENDMKMKQKNNCQFEENFEMLQCYVEYLGKPSIMTLSKQYRQCYQLIECMELKFYQKFIDNKDKDNLPNKWKMNAKKWIKDDCDKRLAELMTLCFPMDFVSGLQLRAKWMAREPCDQLKNDAKLL